MTSMEYTVRVIGSQINRAVHHAPAIDRQNAINRLHWIARKVRGSTIIRR